MSCVCCPCVLTSTTIRKFSRPRFQQLLLLLIEIYFAWAGRLLWKWLICMNLNSLSVSALFVSLILRILTCNNILYMFNKVCNNWWNPSNMSKKSIPYRTHLFSSYPLLAGIFDAHTVLYSSAHHVPSSHIIISHMWYLLTRHHHSLPATVLNLHRQHYRW